MIKLITIITSIILVGCTAPEPKIKIETKIVEVPVPYIPTIPSLPPFESEVQKITEKSSDQDVARAYVHDALILLRRDQLWSEIVKRVNEQDANFTEVDKLIELLKQ